MSELGYNLRLAEFAVKYVNDVMSKGPGPCNQAIEAYHRLVNPRKPEEPVQGSNWFSNQALQLKHKLDMLCYESAVEKRKDILANPVAMRLAIIEEKERIFGKKEEQQKTLMGLGKLSVSDAPSIAIKRGAEIEKSGLGNCGEQSYVAFKYLITKGPPSLAIMDWQLAEPVKGNPSGNHQFVLIGASNLTATTETDLNTPPAWGPFAVICDPWYHEWFAVQTDWSRKMRQILAQTRPDLKDLLVKKDPMNVPPKPNLTKLIPKGAAAANPGTIPYAREDGDDGIGESRQPFNFMSKFVVWVVVKHLTGELIAEASKRHNAANLRVLPGPARRAAQFDAEQARKKAERARKKGE